MSAHNPGPWVTDDGNAEVIYAGKGTSQFEIATVAGPTSVVPHRETSANARLIAASPVMLNALETIGDAFNLDDLSSFTPEQQAALRQAARAVGAARGGA